MCMCIQEARTSYQRPIYFERNLHPKGCSKQVLVVGYHLWIFIMSFMTPTRLNLEATHTGRLFFFWLLWFFLSSVCFLGDYTCCKLLYAASWIAARCYARWSSYYTAFYIEMMRYSGTGSAKFEVGNNMFVQAFASV